MRKIKVILSLVLVTFLLAGCAKELDVHPDSDILMPDQVNESVGIREDNANAMVVGMYAMLKRIDMDKGHAGFGYPSFLLYLEHSGDNMHSEIIAYNHYQGSMNLDRRGRRGSESSYIWSEFYAYIKQANLIIASLVPDKESTQRAVGQAKAFRAWAYFFLAQTFQQTYVGNENAPCLPYVDEKTPLEELSNNPRKSVKEIYEHILKDLDDAASLLQGYKPARDRIGENVVYGIRSRVYLTMNKWAEAAADAQKAIDLSTDRSPYTIDDCSKPNFDDVVASKNVMWGIILTADDDATQSGIVNYTSHLVSLILTGNAYCGTDTELYRQINHSLYNSIPDTDVRKTWWVGMNADSTKNLHNLRDVYKPRFLAAYNKFLPYYANLKFAPNDKDPLSDKNATDVVIMRIEEMYYNLAEAKAMGGDVAGGKAVLEDFVKQYRDPAYSADARGEGLQDEIYHQKRIEFWGEGLSWFDMMRMKKGINRVDASKSTKDWGNGYDQSVRFNVPAGSPLLIYQIPEKEEQQNTAIVQNPNQPKPELIR